MVALLYACGRGIGWLSATSASLKAWLSPTLPQNSSTYYLPHFSGGMYFWIHQLSKDTWGPGLCWVTGYCWLGQIVSLASSSSIITNILSDITLLSTGTVYCCNAPPELPSTPPLTPMAPPMAPGTTADYVALPTGPGRQFTMQQSYAIFVGCIFITTLINTLPYKYLHWITEAGGNWNFLGVIIVIIVIPAVVTQHASADWVFRSFETAQAESASGITDNL
ncbi:hypothetical protein CEUSTIGMA_g6318.t1 [Chlamydomonas eustigma]|uniref:Uncharacterized protein n=1 Tax=Chlamydomonas eustigma TaxID=1157962 RepID=A0A250X7I2_9CHLO|nr:hypothetical protein CEUSTIGMA_g6318.t1 [Chlamydomonas eustigma]|eukprot:GAX78879.1 hypothetical protein CEUSTIGMA_g6318.t1 [Chlamydomonas eustigma]